MGSIFKNGVEYPAGTSKAIDQSYDNTNSGIAAVTTQGAIDELSSNLGNFAFRVNEETNKAEKSTDGGVTWENFSSGGEPVLLWSNPSPNTSFSAQTVNESSNGWVSGEVLSDYDYFQIDALYYYNKSGRNTTFLPRGEGSISASDLNYASVRSATISDSGIVFGNGYQNGSANGLYAIPQTIYGCKAMEVPAKYTNLPQMAVGSFEAEIGKRYMIVASNGGSVDNTSNLIRTIDGAMEIERSEPIGNKVNTYHWGIQWVIVEATSTTISVKGGEWNANSALVIIEQ